jgi:hypothetical protein
MTHTSSGECSVVALYGITTSPIVIKRVYEALLEWFDSLASHPSRLSVHGDDFNGKANSFKEGTSKLEKAGFARVDGFGLYSLVPAGEIPLWDWSVMAELSSELSCCVVGARSERATLSSESLASLIRQVTDAIKPEYGIGYRRAAHLGPALYAIGIPQGIQPWGADAEECSRIGLWGTIGMSNKVFRSGLLRDLYPWNFLTHPQLSQRIGRLSLEQWIRNDGRRGMVSCLGHKALCWTLDEMQIRHVRPYLQEAGVLFDASNVSS